MTCLGDQTRHCMSIEGVWLWGAMPPLGSIPAVSACLGVVSPVFGAPGDVSWGRGLRLGTCHGFGQPLWLPNQLS